MNMIKKIALTASMLLFVLTQIFSFYVIFTGHKEKIELLREKEGRYFAASVKRFSEDVNKLEEETARKEYVITHSFRKYVLNAALYKGTRELYNSSLYEFDVEKTDWEVLEYEYPCTAVAKKINGRYLLVFYMEYNQYRNGKVNDFYYIYYPLDITSVYKNSMSKVIWEIFISVLASLFMACLLTYLIKKITRPLQAVNEAQRQLIGSMSHELKTPLTAIQGYSETLLEVNLSKERQEKALWYIRRESARLSRLSEKMMELTRLYEPECGITLSEVSVESLFETVKTSVWHRLLEKRQSLVLEGAYQGMTKKIDVDLMTSFLINLINNSILASKEGGRIFMGADEKSLWVRDEGCGIAPEEVEKVKKAFYRVDKSRSRKSGNMGLGLALCEQIAAAHQGRMEIESKVGVGTKISFLK